MLSDRQGEINKGPGTVDRGYNNGSCLAPVPSLQQERVHSARHVLDPSPLRISAHLLRTGWGKKGK